MEIASDRVTSSRANTPSVGLPENIKFLGNSSKLSKWIPTTASTYGAHLSKLSDSESDKDSSEYYDTDSDDSDRGIFDTLDSIITSPEKENFNPNSGMKMPQTNMPDYLIKGGMSKLPLEMVI